MKKLILFLFFPVICFGQEINGKWCAEYNSANGDGQFFECIIIQQNTTSIDALRWMTAQCNRCQTVAERKPRLHSMPIKIKESSSKQILTTLGLKYINGELVEVGGSPSGEDVIFERDSKFIMKPSFNCIYAKQDREKAICGSYILSLLDLELSLVFDMAKQCSPKGSLDKAQNNWWKDELSMCQSGDCVPKFYTDRISQLRKSCK